MIGSSGRKANRAGTAAEAAPPSLVHATALALRGSGASRRAEAGVLLRGPSGAGKSDLAFRLIDAGWARLVADDCTLLEETAAGLRLFAPDRLAGRIELRGLGIVELAPHERAEAALLALIVDLVPRESVERLPEPAPERLFGRPVPRLSLHAFDASTPAKVRRALDLIATRRTGLGDPETPDALGALDEATSQAGRRRSAS